MGWLTWLIVGAIAGWLTNAILRGRGLIGDLVVGMIGALSAGFLFNVVECLELLASMRGVYS